jgi:hypothetical protein
VVDDEGAARSYIKLLVDVVPGSSNAKDYAKIVRDKSVLRRLIAAAEDIEKDAYSESDEVETIVDFVRTNNSKVRYNRAFIENIEAEAARAEASNRKDDGDEEGGGENGDSLFENAVRVAIENNKISTSLLQRKLSIGYGRAAKLIDQMEELGYVSEADGNKPRRILLSKEMFMELVTNGTLEG